MPSMDKNVNVFLIRKSDGKILTPIRAESKKKFPNCYDFSVSGKWDEGENELQAIRREMMEELGIKNKIKRIGEIVKNNNQYISVSFFGWLDQEVNWFEPKEVKEIKYFSIDEIKDMLETNPEMFDVDIYKPSFDMLLEYLNVCKTGINRIQS